MEAKLFYQLDTICVNPIDSMKVVEETDPNHGKFTH